MIAFLLLTEIIFINNIIYAHPSLLLKENSFASGSDTLKEKNETHPWSIEAKSEYENSSIKNGVDLSGTNPTLYNSLNLFHEIGFNGRVSYSSMLGHDGGPLDWSADVGYEYKINNWLNLSLGASHTKYLADSINAISDLENSLSTGLTANLSLVNLEIEYEIYLGTNPANYWTADVSHSLEWGALNFDLTATLTYMSQTIDAAKLEALAIKLKKKNQTTSTSQSKNKVKISGLSNIGFDLDITYEICSGFTFYLDPSYAITPKSEISSKDRQLSFLIGLEYSLGY
jgi:hypothetical protein